MSTENQIAFPCKGCGKATRVIDTRPVGFRGCKAVKRKRICPNCEQETVTVEVSGSLLGWEVHRHHKAGSPGYAMCK